MGGTTVRLKGVELSHQSIREYLRVAAGNNPAGPTDAELLSRFTATRDEASFELLVWRHAAIVQRVCLGVLGDHHAAEDAAQAVFLILARKSHTFTGRGSVIGWLYRIGRRVAVRLAKERARSPLPSSRLDQFLAVKPEPSISLDEVETLCLELDHLPERYRVPILLCYFEGLTQLEAARRTGWPIGTVAGRLARAKGLLARRLSHKGIGFTSVFLAMPAGSFVGGTAQAAVSFAFRGAVVPGVKPTVTHLAEGVLKAMTTTKLKFAAVTALGLIAIATGWTFSVIASPQSEPQGLPANTVPAGLAATAQESVKPKQPEPKERLATRHDQMVSENSLKQIMLAIYNYHDANNELPHVIADKDGKPLLSWRVEILPYIEQANLYQQFKRDEPWDSDHNKKLIAHMPNIYRLGFQKKEETKTYFQVFAGPGTVFEPGKKLKITEIADGTSNTLGVVVAGSPVEWTKPADIAYDPKKALPKLELPYKNIFSAAFMDGSVRSFKPDLDPKVLKLLIERDDGQILPDLSKMQVKLPVTKRELEAMRGVLKEDQRILTAIGEQLKEHQKLIEELTKNPDLIDPELDGNKFGFSRFIDPLVLAEILEELKNKNEQLRKIVEGGGKK
jgi:RNA polymerase sigma factor (sigma-70 family)